MGSNPVLPFVYHSVEKSMMRLTLRLLALTLALTIANATARAVDKDGYVSKLLFEYAGD